MGAFRSYALILAIGIAAFGLTITPAKAAQFIINSGGETVTAQEKLIEAGQTGLRGGSDATKSQALDGGLRDDFSWGGFDLLDKPLGSGFSLDNSDTSSSRIQKLLDDGYDSFDQ